MGDTECKVPSAVEYIEKIENGPHRQETKTAEKYAERAKSEPPNGNQGFHGRPYQGRAPCDDGALQPPPSVYPEFLFYVGVPLFPHVCCASPPTQGSRRKSRTRLDKNDRVPRFRIPFMSDPSDSYLNRSWFRSFPFSLIMPAAPCAQLRQLRSLAPAAGLASAGLSRSHAESREQSRNVPESLTALLSSSGRTEPVTLERLSWVQGFVHMRTLANLKVLDASAPRRPFLWPTPGDLGMKSSSSSGLARR